MMRKFEFWVSTDTAGSAVTHVMEFEDNVTVAEISERFLEWRRSVLYEGYHEITKTDSENVRDDENGL